MKRWSRNRIARQVAHTPAALESLRAMESAEQLNNAVPSEDEEQRAVVAYLDERAQLGRPIVYTHPANERARARGRRRAASMGTRKGVSDFLFCSRPVSALELKRQDGGDGLSPEQLAWLDDLAAEGWRTAACNGAAAAIGMIIGWYGT